MRKQIVFLFMASLLLTQRSQAAMAIRQEKYMHNMPLTQNILEDVFVITGLPVTPGNCLPTVHFSIGSASLSMAEKEYILTCFARCKISKKTPLIVTGHTCEKGSKQYNLLLSMQRARGVAQLLRNHGFTVRTVQGKGEQNPLTRCPQELFKNRRVEIAIIH